MSYHTIHTTTNPINQAQVRFRFNGSTLLRQEHNNTRWITTECHHLTPTQARTLKASRNFTAWLGSHGPDLY
jgi:hypothetical protein